jgi:hypothetical protein
MIHVICLQLTTDTMKYIVGGNMRLIAGTQKGEQTNKCTDTKVKQNHRKIARTTHTLTKNSL